MIPIIKPATEHAYARKLRKKVEGRYFIMINTGMIKPIITRKKPISMVKLGLTFFILSSFYSLFQNSEGHTVLKEEPHQKKQCSFSGMPGLGANNKLVQEKRLLRIGRVLEENGRIFPLRTFALPAFFFFQ
jgi:disulfide bond formation protein DsbB